MDVGDEVKSWANWLPGATGSSMTPAALLFTTVSASCLYILIAGLFVSPTWNIPGPLLARFTTLSFFHRIVRGSLGADVVKLHEIYGTFCSSWGS